MHGRVYTNDYRGGTEMGWFGRKEEQESDAEKAIKDFRNRTAEREKSLNVRHAARSIVERKNVIDKLDDDMKNAGRSQYDKDVWGK